MIRETCWKWWANTREETDFSSSLRSITYAMKRRNYLRATAGIAATSTLPLAGCTGGDRGMGTFAAYVSDQPGDIGDFESCIVTISEIRIKPVDGEVITKSVEDVTADLVKLQGDKQQLVNESELAEGEYTYVHVAVSNVDATLEGGETANVDTAGDAGLKFETFTIDGEQSDTFEIRAGETTSFTADFMPVKQGQSGEYVLKPVADEVTVVHGDGENADS